MSSELELLQQEVRRLQDELREAEEEKVEMVKEIQAAMHTAQESAMNELRNCHRDTVESLERSHATQVRNLNETIQMLLAAAAKPADPVQTISDEYPLLHDRFKCVLYENPNSAEIYLEKFYQRILGRRHKRLISPEQLTLLLSRDERIEFEARADAATLGFFETICPRLPRMEFCSIEGHRFMIDLSAIGRIPDCFPSLTRLNAKLTLLTDEDLLALVRHAPRLKTCDVSGCISITWEGIVAARTLAEDLGKAVTLLPETEDQYTGELEKISTIDQVLDPTTTVHKLILAKLQDQYKESLQGPDTIPVEKKLLAFWGQLGGTEHVWDAIDPVHLQVILLNMAAHTLSYRVGNQNDTDIIGEPAPVGEIRGFVSSVLSRINRLRTLTITDSPVWPFDLATIDELEEPFPGLRQLRVYSTPFTRADVVDLCRRLPELQFEVDWNKLQGHDTMTGDDKDELVAQTAQKLRFRM
ncbi:hypothetical protein ADEAN_001002100 [Angomonas deanei]|uniref:Uncharacterized protein n=1 Tax=Angomonas deanei TaxID=59799 RepID=A0A7G2CT94_9TRYP|nr:hypothetical protein ADEAN_001002100 [Angomonas deanei]